MPCQSVFVTVRAFLAVGPLFIVFLGPFYPFSVGKVINLPPGSGAGRP